MLRTIACAVIALLLSSGPAWAEEIKAAFKSADAAKGTITVAVGDKAQPMEKTFEVAKDAKIVRLTPDKNGGAPQEAAVPNGLAGLTAPKKANSVMLTLTTEKKDGKELVTKVVVNAKK